MNAAPTARPGSRYRIVVGILSALLTGTLPAFPAHADQQTEILTDTPRTVRHGSDATYEYHARCQSTDGCLLVVGNEGFDSKLSIEHPDGRFETFNSPMRRWGQDTVLLEGQGPFRISVFSEEFSGVHGGHHIHLVEALGAPEREAYRLLTDASRVPGDNERPIDATAAVGYALDAASIWQTSNQPTMEADALFSAAMIAYWDAENWTLCETIAGNAANRYEALGDEHMMATSSHLKAAALMERAVSSDSDVPRPVVETLFSSAIQILLESREVLEASGDVFQAAEVTNNIGLTYFYMGDWVDASGHWAIAAADFRQLKEWASELNTLSNLSVVDGEIGNLRTAITGFERILDLLPEDRSRTYRANVLNNLGAARRRLGDTDGARSAFTSALEMHEARNDTGGEARALSGLGETYYTIGEFDLATEYLEYALPKAISSNHGRIIEHLYQYLGNIAFFRSELEDALELHREALAKATSRPVESHVHSLISRDLRALNRPAEAMTAAELAYETAVSTTSERLRAQALVELGAANVDLGNNAGISQLQEALIVYRDLGLPENIPETLHQLARAEAAAGNTEIAMRAARDAIAEMESLRGQVADPDLRAFFSSSRSHYYEHLISLILSDDGKPREVRARDALTVAEQSRTQATLERLGEASSSVNAIGVVQTEDIRALYRQLAEARYRQNRLLSSGIVDDPEYRSVLRELTDVENQINLAEAEVRTDTAGLTAEDETRTLSAEEIQARLDAETLLVQYVLSAPQSWVWFVRSDGIEVFPLADRQTVESAARTLLETLRVPQSLGGNRSTRIRDLQAFSSLIFPDVAIPSVERLIIAADSALHYVPFPALPSPGIPDGDRLMEAYEVTMIPSMSVVTMQLRDRTPPSRTVALFADPVFTAEDPRIRRRDAKALSTASAVPATARNSPLPDELARLPGTAREAATIAAMIDEPQRLVVTGLAATREAVLSAPLADFRILHFATHGLVDSRYPALSSLALSQMDSSGNEIDGLLRLYDIYNLELNSDVVVLSACDTALGREIRGEGLIGLTQGFLFAGAKSMVASLWNVSDEATTELMTNLYQSMIEENMTPAAALRSAQRSMAVQGRWRDPYYWAAFVILGDWR